MKTSIEINVTQEDIREGYPTSCVNCPVARAMRRALPHVDFIMIGSLAATWSHDDKDWRWRLPGVIVIKIDAFDRGRGMKPFSFNIKQSEVW